MAERSGKAPTRQPATKFAHLQKKMNKAQQSKRDVHTHSTRKKNDKHAG